MDRNLCSNFSTLILWWCHNNMTENTCKLTSSNNRVSGLGCCLYMKQFIHLMTDMYGDADHIGAILWERSTAGTWSVSSETEPQYNKTYSLLAETEFVHEMSSIKEYAEPREAGSQYVLQHDWLVTQRRSTRHHLRNSSPLLFLGSSSVPPCTCLDCVQVRGVREECVQARVYITTRVGVQPAPRSLACVCCFKPGRVA